MSDTPPAWRPQVLDQEPAEQSAASADGALMADKRRRPRWQRLGRGLLVVLGLGLAGVGLSSRYGGKDAYQTAAQEPAAVRALQWQNTPDEGPRILDAMTGEDLSPLVADRPAVPGTLRVLMLERRQAGIEGGRPFLLTRDDGGRLVLRDPELQRTLDLQRLGQDHVTAFAILLKAR